MNRFRKYSGTALDWSSKLVQNRSSILKRSCWILSILWNTWYSESTISTTNMFISNTRDRSNSM